MGKDLDILQAVKDNDQGGLHKLLLKAAKHGKNKIIANKKLNINYQDGDGMSALHQAALMSSDTMLRTLLDNGASPGLRDNKGMIALHYATWQGSPKSVQILLQKGSPVNEQALNGETPLHLASQHGHFEVATLLLNQHADPTICNKDLKTSLDLACEFGKTRVVELLIRSNLCQKLLEDSPTDNLDNNRTTCLHLAARGGHVDIIKLLLQEGMNINRSTLKGTCLHEAALACRTEAVKLLLDCGVDVNKPDSYDQTALDIVNKFTTGHAGKELKHILKEASCAVYARATRDYANVYDPGSLTFKEGDIITVLEQRSDGIWRGYVLHDGRMAKTGMFPANHVVLVDSKVVARQQQLLQQQKPATKTGHMHGPVPDLLNRGPIFSSHQYGGDRGAVENPNIEDSQPTPPHSFPCSPSSNYPPPPSSLLTSYPPRSPLTRDASGADSGFSSSQSLPQFTPSSPAAPQLGKSPFAFGQTVIQAPNGPYYNNNGTIPEYQQHHGEWPPAPTTQPPMGGMGADMRGVSPAKDSPGHSNRNSSASSDSGRGFSTGHVDAKPVHSYVNVHVNNQQHRLSGQSYESGVSSRQSYHSTSSSSLGSLDRLEEPGYTSTINVAQLFQAGVPDNEVLHAWLHDLGFVEYYPLFYQAGYDMPTISRMTPEDLTAIGITKPTHRKRLKTEIARLNIHDGIPDFRPNDLMEWLHLLGLGTYLDTLCGQGYDNIDYVTDITWEDLEEIGIQKLGHQKKIMLAIDRLKRITSGGKRLSSVDGRTASLELLEPPPPAPPITGRWSGGEITAIPQHVYDGALSGARPKRSPSGDSISTTSSGNSGSSVGSGAHGGSGSLGEMRVIPLPREDAVGLAGAIPYRHNSTGSTGNTQPDVVAIQVKRSMRSSTSEDNKKESTSQPLMYHSFQGSTRRSSETDVFLDSTDSEHGVYQLARSCVADKQVNKIMAKSDSESHESHANNDGSKNYYHGKSHNNNGLRVESGEHIYDTPQIAPVPQISPNTSMSGSLHVNTSTDLGGLGPAKPTSPGGKGAKKIPPPPPKRTHSIREETTLLSQSAPASPSRNTVAPTTITVSASVHPQPSAMVANKQAPPPVMQKPQKPHSPAVANKFQQPQIHPMQQLHSQQQQLAQQQQHHTQQQSDQSQQQQHPQQQFPPQQQSHPQQQLIPQQHNHSKQQHPQHQQLHPQQQLLLQQQQLHQKQQFQIQQQQLHPQQMPSKQQQHHHFHQQQSQAHQQLIHPQPQQPLLNPPVAQKPLSPKPQKMVVPTPATSSSGGLNPQQPPVLAKPKVSVIQPQVQPKSPLVTNVPKSHPSIVSHTATQQQPSQHSVSNPPTQSGKPSDQGQQFASCVKSLSEKFGKQKDEEDQFPDNVSTDSDDFPPPPPPIAMDIITPKIHNYGIPSSRDRGKADFGIHTNRPRPNPAGGRNFISQSSSAVNQHRPTGHVLPVMSSPKITPEPTHTMGSVQLRKHPIMSSANSSPAGSDREYTPEPDHVSTISHDKRSESTTSFESNSSSSSIDSNTLPFANENVGTIKQRAANTKASIVHSLETEGGQRNVELNPKVFDGESLRAVSGYSNSSYLTSTSYNQHNSESFRMSDHGVSQPLQLAQQKANQSLNISGTMRAPLPSKKPTLSPKPSRASIESTVAQTPVPEVDSQKHVESGNVLSDIDDMLQGLTDELDAMLEEEMTS